MRRSFTVFIVFFILQAWLFILPAQVLTHGPVVGAVSSDSANFVLRTDMAADVFIQLSTDPNFSAVLSTDTVNTGTVPDDDFWAKLKVNGLTPNTMYYYRVVINGNPVVDGVDRHFHTFPIPGTVSNFMFLTGSCQQAGDDPFSSKGFIFPIMAEENAAFFLHQGDWGYPDTTDSEKGMPTNFFPLDFANVQASYRARYTPDFPMIDLLRVMPVDYVYDDHDMVNDNSDKTFPGIANSIKGYMQYFPHYKLEDPTKGLWHEFSYGNADFFMLDNRSQRDPNLAGFDIFAPDSIIFNPPPGHSILGDEQMNWLMQALSNSTATWKFISTGTPFNPGLRVALELAVLLQGVVPGVPTPQGFLTPTQIAAEFADKWAGFPEDIHKLVSFIIDNNIQNVIFLSGDIHTSAIDDGTNSIFPELVSSPLDRINGAIVALLEQFGIFIFDKGGHTSNQSDFGDAYGRVTVFGSDSVRLEIVSEKGTILGKHTVVSGYLPASIGAAIGPLGIPFDTVKVNSQNVQAFIAVSTSKDTLEIDQINVVGSNNFFVIPPGFLLPTRIPPGEKAIFGVIYQPTTEGADTAIIQVHTNAPKTPLFNILATGYSSQAVAINKQPNLLNQFELKQNYPNPFNPSTTIEYTIPIPGHVEVTIYSITGEKIKTLINENQSPGVHKLVWDGTNRAGEKVGSGVYFYRLNAGIFQQSKKMILIR